MQCVLSCRSVSAKHSDSVIDWSLVKQRGLFWDILIYWLSILSLHWIWDCLFLLLHKIHHFLKTNFIHFHIHNIYNTDLGLFPHVMLNIHFSAVILKGFMILQFS